MRSSPGSNDATPLHFPASANGLRSSMNPSPPLCHQNPYKGAIEPLNLVAGRMDRWLWNVSAAYERSYR